MLSLLLSGAPEVWGAEEPLELNCGSLLCVNKENMKHKSHISAVSDESLQGSCSRAKGLVGVCAPPLKGDVEG